MMPKLNYLVPVKGKIKLYGSEEDYKKSSKYFCYLAIISSWTNLNLHLCQVWLTLHGKLTIWKVSNRQTNWQNVFQTTGWTEFICLQLLAVHAVVLNTTYFTIYLLYIISPIPQCMKPWNNQKYSFLAIWLSILHNYEIWKLGLSFLTYFCSSMECDSFPKGQICVKLTNQYKWCRVSQHSLLEIDE